MKVYEVMHKKVDFVTPQSPLKKAVKVIFGKKHTGLPVVESKTKKLIGFVTDQDILSKCFPSIKDYFDDVVHGRDFGAMEKKVKEILKLQVKDVMNKNVDYIHKDDPVLKAESLMKVHDIARLPVVDDKKRLIGIVTKREIFRALVGKYF